MRWEVPATAGNGSTISLISGRAVHEADYLDQFVGNAFDMLNQEVIRFMEMLVLVTAQRLSDRGVAPLVVVVFQCGCLSCKSLKQRRSRRLKVLIILVRKGCK